MLDNGSLCCQVVWSEVWCGVVLQAASLIAGQQQSEGTTGGEGQAARQVVELKVSVRVAVSVSVGVRMGVIMFHHCDWLRL